MQLLVLVIMIIVIIVFACKSAQYSRQKEQETRMYREQAAREEQRVLVKQVTQPNTPKRASRSTGLDNHKRIFNDSYAIVQKTNNISTFSNRLELMERSICAIEEIHEETGEGYEDFHQLLPLWGEMDVLCYAFIDRTYAEAISCANKIPEKAQQEEYMNSYFSDLRKCSFAHNRPMREHIEYLAGTRKQDLPAFPVSGNAFLRTEFGFEIVDTCQDVSDRLHNRHPHPDMRSLLHGRPTPETVDGYISYLQDILDDTFATRECLAKKGEYYVPIFDDYDCWYRFQDRLDFLKKYRYLVFEMEYEVLRIIRDNSGIYQKDIPDYFPEEFSGHALECVRSLSDAGKVVRSRSKGGYVLKLPENSTNSDQ